MIKADKIIKYLNHEFITAYALDSDILICFKCKVKVFWDYQNKFSTFNRHSRQWTSFKLTCEEQIIKNIIE